MKDSQSHFFWPSYTDLMTSLFFVMLVLYVLTYVRLKSTIKLQKEKLAIIEAVESNLKPLKKDTALFKYEEKYKRFKLSFEVSFPTDVSDINKVNNYSETITKINQAGQKLKAVINSLKVSKDSDTSLRNVSYILVIAGYASKTGGEDHNYTLSYNRAFALWKHWKSTQNIDFENPGFADLIDLQISGNGWGGVGRELEDSRNQRFLIQIFPKIGDIK